MRTVIAALVLLAPACTTGNSTQLESQASETTQPSTTLRSAEVVEDSTSTTSQATTTTTAASSDGTPSTTLPGDPISGGPTFTLVAAGAEPRQLLRYSVDAGQSSYSVFEAQELVQDIEGLDDTVITATSLETVYGFEIIPDPDDPVRYTIVSSPTDVQAAADDEVSIQVADLLRGPFSEVETRVMVNNRGIKLSASATGTESLIALGPEFEAIVNDITTVELGAIPLPETPVGLGARWNVVTDLPISGFRVIQTVTYEVVAISDTTIELVISGTQVSNSQSVPNPGVPNSEISVVEWDVTITGSAMIDLNHFINVTSQTASGTQELTVTQGPLETSVEQSIITTVRIEPDR